MRLLLLAIPLIATLGCTSPSLSEGTEKAQVIQVVDAFMRSIKEQDSKLMASVTADEGTASGLIYKDGNAAFHSESFDEGRKRLARGDEAEWVESYRDPIVLIHKGVAVFWAPYSMEVDGIQVHCGIDVFNLAKVDEDWKIVSIQFTAEPEGCPDQD